jgi:hypothetical protein
MQRVVTRGAGAGVGCVLTLSCAWAYGRCGGGRRSTGKAKGLPQGVGVGLGRLGEEEVEVGKHRTCGRRRSLGWADAGGF